MPDAVVFDLDGVLIDSEVVWNEARRALTESAGGHWREDAQRAMMGMSSVEWSRYMNENLAVPMPAQDISAAVVTGVERLYRRRLPLVPGAREAVLALARRWPLAIASSANRRLIDLVLELAGLDRCFEASVSSEEVPRGKPAPDVYLEAARRIAHPPDRCAAVEDSGNGIRAAARAGMSVLAIPNREFPPEPDALAEADVVLPSITELGVGVVEGLDR
ncbi:MAG TPA: HAD family phosphatase [Solirubrobacteraceae bacterium]|jgi:HAD superfamily hydrolase (TIGR01509 family)